MAKSVNRLSEEEIALVRESSLLLGKTLAEVARMIAPGVTTAALDRMAEEFIRDNGGVPGFKGLYGCPSSLLISVNEQVVHGLPGDRFLQDGDVASVDCGVLMNGFGFTGAMEKLGVERRLLTAGENKGFLDPFSPPNPGQEEYAKKMLNDIHEQFIQVVKEGRGARLKETPEIFSGIVWTGQKSIELGLVDAIGSADYVAREIIKAEHIVDYTTREGFSERLARRFGAVAAEALITTGIGGGLR